MRAYVDNYCNSNPLNYVADAAMALVKELRRLFEFVTSRRLPFLAYSTRRHVGNLLTPAWGACIMRWRVAVLAVRRFGRVRRSAAGPGRPRGPGQDGWATERTGSGLHGGTGEQSRRRKHGGLGLTILAMARSSLLRSAIPQPMHRRLVVPALRRASEHR